MAVESRDALQWGGTATIVSQLGHNATVQFNTPGNDLIMWAQNNTQGNPPQRRFDNLMRHVTRPTCPRVADRP